MRLKISGPRIAAMATVAFGLALFVGSSDSDKLAHYRTLSRDALIAQLQQGSNDSLWVNILAGIAVVALIVFGVDGLTIVYEKLWARVSQKLGHADTLSPQAAMWRELTYLVGLPFALVVGLVVASDPSSWSVFASWHPAAGTSVFAVARGTWDWETADGFCQKDPHHIWFSDDSSVMFIGYDHPWTDSLGKKHEAAVYDIQEHTDNRIRGLIRGEVRRTPGGKPVVWDLELTSRDSYTWHRTDWMAFNHTGTIRRCTAADTAPTSSAARHP